MGKFWIRDEFIREQTEKLDDVYASMIYVVLSCYANEDGETFVGYRTIAKNLGINKDTVAPKIKKLEAYGLVIRLGDKNTEKGKVSVLKLTTVLIEPGTVSEEIIPKEEIFKEDFKEVKNPKGFLSENFPEVFNKIYDRREK